MKVDDYKSDSPFFPVFCPRTEGQYFNSFNTIGDIYIP